MRWLNTYRMSSRSRACSVSGASFALRLRVAGARVGFYTIHAACVAARVRALKWSGTDSRSKPVPVPNGQPGTGQNTMSKLG